MQELSSAKKHVYTCKRIAKVFYSILQFTNKMPLRALQQRMNKGRDSVKDGRPGHNHFRGISRSFLIDDSMTDDVGYSRLDYI